MKLQIKIDEVPVICTNVFWTLYKFAGILIIVLITKKEIENECSRMIIISKYRWETYIRLPFNTITFIINNKENECVTCVHLHMLVEHLL